MKMQSWHLMSHDSSYDHSSSNGHHFCQISSEIYADRFEIAENSKLDLRKNTYV